MTGLLVPGPLDERERAIVTPSHCHPIGVMMVTLLIPHFVVISIIWNSLIIAARHWGPSWTNKRICVETDNTQAMVFINKGSCKNPIPMYWLWELFWLSVRHNFHLRKPQQHF